MRERERVRRYLALLLAFTMIFTSSSMNVLAATIVGGYKNSDKSQTTVEESETTVETEAPETEAPETNEDGTEIRKNVVTFSTNGHAHVVVDGTTVESTAYAKDGKIVFDVAVENGYQIESVLVDKSINARTTENGSYIIEGIQTDNTTVDITTVEVETEAQTETSTETETESESESESETESETKLSEESEISKPAQKLTITAADGARITVNAPEGALPEGSSVNAIVIESRAIETILENTIEAEGKELNNYKAYDITIIGPDGVVIQPDDSVKVSIRNAGVDGEENAVYHVDGASANKIADVANGNSASFETDHFSIYVITGENTPAIATYEFYDGTNLISSQSVKNGESLVEPAAPEHDGRYFTGWFIEGTSTPITFSTPASVSETGTVKVVAKYEDAYYVFFKNSSGIVICTKEGKTGDVISTSDVTFPVSGTQGITGWYEDEGLTKKVETVTLGDEDVVLYPKVENGYYITYQSNGGSYTAPVFILPTENTTAPNIPAKPGYTFKYWSLTENGSEYRFGEKLTENITLYAVWEAKNTNYLIMYWMENANYGNLYLSADKRDVEQYSYAASVTGKGKTGEETNVSGWNGKVPTGFTLQSIRQQTIAGDGSTVVNVYIKRNTYDVKFMYNRYNRWSENIDLRITAKYGANIESEWPGYNWRTSSDGSTYQTHLFTMPAGGATFYEANKSGRTSSADYYVEVLPGERGTITKNRKQYKLHHTDRSYGSGYSVTDEDRYDIEGYTCNTSLSPRNRTSWDGAKFYYNRNQYDIIFINEGTKADQISKYFEQSLTGVSCSKELTPPAGKESYVFAGWYDNPEGEGNQYTFTGRIMPAKNVTVYAKWVAPTFNITVYSTIDASDEPIVYKKVLGSKLSSDELSVTAPDGHTFRGWYFYENGQRTSLYNPDTEIHGDIALVPYWTSDETFKVSYEAGTGTGTVTDEFEYTEDAQAEVKSAASLTAPDADSYFQGWLSDTDNRVYYPGDVYLMKGDVTFTAQWGKEEKTTVFYQSGIGSGTSQSFDAANNAEIVTKTPEELKFTGPDGYTFVGWSYTNSDGKPAVADAGEALHVDTKTTPGNTLTAQWAKLSAIGGTWTYDGQSHTVSNVSVEGVDGYTVTYKVDDTEYTDVTSVAISSVGEKNVTVIARKAGYRQLEKTVTLKITPIEVTVSVTGNNDNRVYNGSVQSVNGYSISSDNTLYSVTDMVNGPTQENAIASRTDVGTTYMGLSKDSFTNVNNNFNVTFAVTDGYITITAKDISQEDNAEVNYPVDVVYNGNQHKWTPTVTDKEGNTLTEETDYTVSYDTDNFVDVKTINVTITGKGNYSGSVTRTYKITPASATVTANNKNKMFGEADPKLTADVSGLYGTDKVEYTLSREPGENVGDYAITASGEADQGNYTVTYKPGTLTITRKGTLTVTGTSYEGTYDGNEHGSAASVNVTEGTVISYKVGDGDWTAEVPTIKDVGSKEVTVKAENPNYVTAEATYTLTVNPKDVTVTADDKNKVYGDADPELTATDSGLLGTDKVTYTLSREAGEEEGTYAITPSGEETQGNYTVTYNPGTLTITVQSIVPEDPSYRGVTVDDPEDHEYDAQEHKWTPTVTDKEGNTLTEGSDYEVSYDTENFVDVKTINVTITGKGNYSGSVIKTYEITPKAVTILTYTDSKVYDGKALTANGEVNGLVEGETVGFVTTGSQTYVGSSDNTYEITWAQEEVEVQTSDKESAPYTAKRSNYIVSETIGTLTVTDGAEEEPVEPNLVVKKNDEQADGYQYKLGETVSFVISVTNIYDEAKDVTITELAGVIIEGADAGAPNVLVKTNVAPGETVTAAASYTITEEDIANGFFRNIVKAAFDGGKTFENEKTVDTEEADRSYSLNKTASESTHESGMFKAGETIHYTITAVNTGNQTIKNLQIEDTLKAAGTISNITADGVTYIQNGTTTIFTITELPAKAYNAEKAESVVIEYDYLVQEADKGNAISNAIIGRNPENPEKPGEGGGTENTVEDPKLEVTKNVTSIVAQDGTVKDVTGKASLHDMITYQVTVKNTGNIKLMDVKLADSLGGIVLAENDSFDIGTLDVGEEKKVTYTYTVKEADLGSTIVNVATATGDVPEDPEDTLKPSGKDEKEVPTDEKSSAIQVTKTVTSQGSTITVDGKETTGYRVGDTIEFNIHVENIGNITVNNIIVNDVPTLSAGSPNGQITIQAGDGYTVNESTATIATLAPKASVDIKASYLVIAGDGTLNGNELSNAAFATGTSEDSNNPQPGDSSKTDPVPIEPEPDGHAEMQGSITVTKMITTSANKTPENGVDAVIKVGLYDNASFSGTPIAVNTITISKATSGSTVFDELDNTSNTTYYVAELDANNNPIIGASAHLDGYGVPSYSENCKNGINPTTAADTNATIVNPLAANDDQDETEETEETEKETSSTTKPSGSSKTSGSAKSSTAAKTGDDTNMMVYWMLLGMAALAGCAAVVYRKKKKNQ